MFSIVAVCLMRRRSGGVFTGVLDLASNNTVGNWLAARDLDMTSIAQGQVSSYPRETGRSRPLMCAPFDTVSAAFVQPRPGYARSSSPSLGAFFFVWMVLSHNAMLSYPAAVFTLVG